MSFKRPMTLLSRFVICLAAFICVLGIGVCIADTVDDELTVSYTAQPVGMVVPEEILVRLTLTFTDTQNIGNIRICREDGTVIANVNKDNIESGIAYVLSDTMIPTEKQLNNGKVIYTVNYTRDFSLPSATERLQTVNIALEKLPANPGIEFSRSCVHTVVSSGEDTGIIYKVYNTGNVDITNLYVSDRLLGEVARVDKLEPGQRMSFTKNVNITRDSISIPKIVYSHAATSDSFTSELAPTYLKVANEDLTVSLSTDAQSVMASGTAKLKCAVRNHSDVSYSGITIYDATLGEILLPASTIEPGEEIYFEKTASIKSATDFRFRLNCVCETGRLVEIESNVVSIGVNSESSSGVNVGLTARIVSFSDEGASVELKLINNGACDVENARLSERSRGIFKTIFVLPPGETVLTRTFSASSGDKLAFMVEIMDGYGGMLTILSNEVRLSSDTPRIEAKGAAPALLDKIDAESLKVPDVYNTYTNMILFAVLALIILIITAMISIARRKREKKRSEDERTKSIRRVLMRAGITQEEDVDSSDITLAVYDQLRKEKKDDPITKQERKPGTI